MNPTLIIVAVICLFILATYIKNNWKRWKYKDDIEFGEPATKRKDLYIGFYGTQDNQVAETQGAFNLLLEGQFDGPDKCAQNILDAQVDTILYVAAQLFSDNVPGQKHTVRADAVVRLNAFFEMLRSKGALKYVKAICPIDEPNNTVKDAEELARAILTLKVATLQFPDLLGCKLATFYAADKPFICQDLYDWIGYDDYDMGSHILVSDKYRSFVQSLRPNQHVMLIPGAAYKQKPMPFVNYAQTHSEVIAVVAFLWLDERNTDVGAKGARSNGMAEQYLAAGRSVVNA